MDRAAPNYTPVSPHTPTNPGSYQVNVNRTKTKKWVEARVQSYDGDDWGADEYDDDDDDEDVQPSTQAPQSGVPAPETRLHSQPRNAAGASVSPQTHSPTFAAGTAPSQPRFTHKATPSLPSSSDRDSILHHRAKSELGGRGLAIVTNPIETERPGATAHPHFAPLEPSILVESRDQEEEFPSRKHSWEDNDHDLSKDKLQPSPRYRQQAFGDRDDKPSDDTHQVSTYPDEIRNTRPASVSPQLPNVARMSSFGVELLAAAGLSSPPSPHEQDDGMAAVASPTRDSADGGNAHMRLSMTDATSPLGLGMTDADAAASQTGNLHPASELPPWDHDGGHEAEKSPSHGIQAVELPVTPATHDEAKDEERSPDVSLKESSSSDAKEEKESMEQGHGLQPFKLDGASILPLRPLSSRKSDEPVNDGGIYREAGDAVKSGEGAATQAHFQAQPVQRGDTFSTMTSSPVKESDVLRDEILRSLSPGAGQDETAVGTGSYTLGGHDSYWRDGGQKIATVAPVSDEMHERRHSHADAGLQASPTSVSGPRRRFSWEADDHKRDSSSASSETRGPAGGPDANHGSDANEAPSSPIALDDSDPQRDSVEGPTSALDQATPALDPASTAVELPGTDEALGQMAMRDGGTELTVAAPPPPSPGSLASDGGAAAAASVSGYQPVATETRHLRQTGSGEMVPDDKYPAGGDWPSARGSVQQSVLPVMTFREILAMGSSEARIAKFNETRNYFAHAQFGLDAWLTALEKQHLELATPFGTSPGMEPIGKSLSATSHQSFSVSPPATHQAQPSSPKGRSRIAGLSISSQSGGIALGGHSSAQLGTKGKEFMHSAGKMGKGLLSKGKNKLRSSGDKDEIYTMGEYVEGSEERQASVSLADEAAPSPSRRAFATTNEMEAAGRELERTRVRGLGLILYPDGQGDEQQQACQHISRRRSLFQDEEAEEQATREFRLPPIRRNSTINLGYGATLLHKDHGGDASAHGSNALELSWDSTGQMASFNSAANKSPLTEPIPSTIFAPRLADDAQAAAARLRHDTTELLALPIHSGAIRTRQVVLRGSVPNLAKGPWKLEESHLTKPLARHTRNRSATTSSQPPAVMTSYEKETGLTTPILSPKPTRPTRSEVLLSCAAAAEFGSRAWSSSSSSSERSMSQDDDYQLALSGETSGTRRCRGGVAQERVDTQRREVFTLGGETAPRSYEGREFLSLGGDAAPPTLHHGRNLSATSSLRNLADSGTSPKRKLPVTPSMTPSIQSRGSYQGSHQGSHQGSYRGSYQGAYRDSYQGATDTSSPVVDKAGPSLAPSLMRRTDVIPKRRANISMPGIRNAFRRARLNRTEKSQQLHRENDRTDADSSEAMRTPSGEAQKPRFDVVEALWLPPTHGLQEHTRRVSTSNLQSHSSAPRLEATTEEAPPRRATRPQSAGILSAAFATWDGHGAESSAANMLGKPNQATSYLDAPPTMAFYRQSISRTPRPSPLGAEEPLTLGNLGTQAVPDERIKRNDGGMPHMHHVGHVSEPFTSTTHSYSQAVQRAQSLRLAGIGAQHEELPRGAMSSPPCLSAPSPRRDGGARFVEALPRYALASQESMAQHEASRESMAHYEASRDLMTQQGDESKQGGELNGNKKKKKKEKGVMEHRTSRLDMSGLFRGLAKRMTLGGPEVDAGVDATNTKSRPWAQRRSQSFNSLQRMGQAPSQSGGADGRVSRWKGLGTRLLGHISQRASSTQGGPVDQGRKHAPRLGHPASHGNEGDRRNSSFTRREQPRPAHAASQSVSGVEALRSGLYGQDAARYPGRSQVGPVVFESVPVPRRYEVVHGEASFSRRGDGKEAIFVEEGARGMGGQSQEEAPLMDEYNAGQFHHIGHHLGHQYSSQPPHPRALGTPMMLSPELGHSRVNSRQSRVSAEAMTVSQQSCSPIVGVVSRSTSPRPNQSTSTPRAAGKTSRSSSSTSREGEMMRSRTQVKSHNISRSTSVPTRRSQSTSRVARSQHTSQITSRVAVPAQRSRSTSRAAPTPRNKDTSQNLVPSPRSISSSSSVASAPAAELDDTAGRYARTQRLKAQEEKIVWRPEESAEWQPPMRACSYPGQEWNPYEGDE